MQFVPVPTEVARDGTDNYLRGASGADAIPDLGGGDADADRCTQSRGGPLPGARDLAFTDCSGNRFAFAMTDAAGFSARDAEGKA
jgi:hypothetical protein